MRFLNDTVCCESCGREINKEDDKGGEDISLCRACRAKEIQKHRKTKCAICNSYHQDDYETLAHTECAYDWSDDFD